MEMTFRIDAGDAEKVREWIKTHSCKIRGKYQGAIAGATTYSFTNTTIGQIQTVECGCGEKFTLDNM
jgi:hypothetical protein